MRSVTDGDTFRLTSGERIRLIGIDAPENEPWKNRVDFYGKEASDFTKKILTGKKVLLESDMEPTDKYGRSLAYVWLENGEFINQTLVEEGYAKAKNYPPNDRYRALLKAAEKKARLLHRGMWSGLDNLPSKA